MKKYLILIGLILLTGFLAGNTSAQTETEKPKPATPAKSPDATPTRTRRAATPQPVASPAPTPESKTEPTPEAPGKTESETPVKTEEAKPAPAAKSVTATTSDSEPVAPEQLTPPVTTTPVDPIQALRDQINAAPTDEERIPLRLKLAEEFVVQGNKPEAITELLSITATAAFNPQGFYNAGNALARLGETDGAIEAYQKAIEQRKGRYSRALNNLGVVLLRVGKWDESYDALSSALKLENFRYPEASYNLGRLYLARGQADLAVREWRRVLKMNPEHQGARDALARVRTEDRVMVQTAGSARTRSDSTTPGEPVFTASASDKPAGLKNPSTAAASKSLVLDQVSFDFLQRARTSMERGNSEDAVENYKRMLSRNSGYFAPGNLELSFVLMSLKRYDEALTNLLLVVNRDGGRYPITYFYLGRVYEVKNDLKQAQIAFEKAATSYGAENGQFLLDVSRVREKQGDFKGALEAMESYMSMMKGQGLEPAWSEERLTALRQKAAAVPPKE